jgi:hypothetical protein
VFGVAEKVCEATTPGRIDAVSVRLLFWRRPISSGGSIETADSEILKPFRDAALVVAVRPITRSDCRLTSAK